MLLEADPGLPKTNATESYWLHIKHHLASVQTDVLPEMTDIAVIGSGITGTSVTKSLLQSTINSSERITVFEARTLCSGATGRNGGNLLTYGGLGYEEIKSVHGRDVALKLIDFTFGTIKATKKAVEEYAAEESQLRAVTRIHTFRDQGLFEAAQRSVSEFQKDKPEYMGTYTVISGQEALKDYDIHGVVGAILYSGYSLWPYRFIACVWEALLKEYSPRLTVETHTPVLEITHDPSFSASHPYTLHTPRGKVQASKIIHCTNGYSSHLLPPLRGLVFPYLETMTVQDLHVARRELCCWATIQAPTQDSQSGAKTSQLCYLQQNLESGYYFFGGSYMTAAETLTSNDAINNSRSTAYLQEQLHEFLGVKPGTGDLVSEWTGVQGMTSDHMPLVGKLPRKLTSRNGDGEWIAAGYNGGGMCMCWRVGEAVAMMVNGNDPPQWLPEPFLISQQRLENALKVENSLLVASRLLPEQVDSEE
ncbi:uncharacterized protein N7496_007565 [Penicillium cataractarum]|uniref:FAD dependent oxidoreductase domain-containing protein n=1 Tax=Penicillium cataractarum TaxID=2100454 RepID=A0A9W9S8C1_9EURO|nr:uncharacterized protein N7496_007565 [Penicillium cataractarum]KAJ5371473.1 hypothetical protein N7496_007565 [Penicillium cataractarum]